MMQGLRRNSISQMWMSWIWLIAFVVGLDTSVSASPVAMPMRMLTAADFSKPGLRGFNIGQRQQPPLGGTDFQDLAATGANLARIILPSRKCDACTGYTIAPVDLAYADQVVAMGEKYGFYVVLTLSPQPAGDKAEYWRNAGLQRSIQDNWAQLATRYRGRAGVAGYDLINEPVPQVWFDKKGAWRTFSLALVETIRKVDLEHVIIVEPASWGHAQEFKDWAPLPFPNLVYSFHYYEPYKMTHQGLYESHEVIPYPNADWNKTRLSQMLEPVRAFAARYRVPVLVGEFSIVRWAPGNSARDYLSDVIGLFEKEGWPWLYHAFREAPPWDAEMPESAERNPVNRKNARRGDTPSMRLLEGYLKQNRL